jgi:O-acetyl-ADP-ribose deacetylase (regulator of RNase III)
MKYIKGNLFCSSDHIGHCVSKDLRMGAGIALQFKNKYGNVNILREQNKNIGEVAYFYCDKEERYIFYLITKDKFYQKPTYKQLELSLINLCKLCKELDIKTISLPQIACGLDNLDWDEVKLLIEKHLVKNKIHVNIYFL